MTNVAITHPDSSDNTLKPSSPLTSSGGNVSLSVTSIISPEAFEDAMLRAKVGFLSGTNNTIPHLNDNKFVGKLNNHVFNNVRNISRSPSVDSYNEIYFFLHFFSSRIGTDFFSDGDIYSKNNFERIFDAYIDKIKSFDDVKSLDFLSYLDSYTRLCSVLNLICILSQNDNLKRDVILSLSPFLKGKIEEIFKILKEKGYKNIEIENSLNFILGLIPLNFSYVEYVSFDNQTKDEDLEGKSEDDKNKTKLNNFLIKYREILSQTIGGYYQCDISDFGNDRLREPFIKKVSLINTTQIISLILQKLNGKVSENELLENPEFQSIMDSYLDNISILYLGDKMSYSSIADIKRICNLIFIRNYEGLSPGLISHSDSSDEIINTFLSNISKTSGKVDEVDNLEIIHHLLLLNDYISSENLFKLLEFLHIAKSSSNINYEVLKLKTFNIILTRLVGMGDLSDKLRFFLGELTKYIDKNKVSSHLLFVYSLMYVSIGYCYSFFNDEESQSLASENYSKFRQMNFGNFDFVKYGINIDRFYMNFGRYKAIKYGIVGGDCENTECAVYGKGKCFDNVKNCRKVNSEDTKKWGKGQLEDFSKLFVEQRINDSLDDLDNFISIQKNKQLDFAGLSEYLSRVMSNIFHGVATFEVLDIHSSNYKSVTPRYNTNLEVPLMNGYVVRITFPNTFGDYFKKLYMNSARIESWDKYKEPNGIIGRTFSKLKNFFESYNDENGLDKELIMDFEDALEKGRIDLFFQGISDRKRNIVKYEVLTRIKNPKNIDGKVYNIRDYIDAINRMKRPDLLKKLIKHIIENSKNLIEKHKGLSLSINLEYSDIVDDEIISLLEQMGEDGFSTDRLTIELIEGKWDNNETALNNIRRLKIAGYKIAMDDFGAGESSINRLLRLLNAPITFKENGEPDKVGLLDVVKIDGDIIKRLKGKTQFTIKSLMKNISNRVKALTLGEKDKLDFIVDLVKDKDIVSDKDSVLIIKMLVGICKNRGVDLISEFVENETLFERLKGLGLKLFQGYGLSRPISLTVLESDLSKRQANDNAIIKIAV